MGSSLAEEKATPTPPCPLASLRLRWSIRTVLCCFPSPRSPPRQVLPGSHMVTANCPLGQGSHSRATHLVLHTGEGEQQESERSFICIYKLLRMARTPPELHFLSGQWRQLINAKPLNHPETILHPSTPGLWKNCLPRNRSLMPQPNLWAQIRAQIPRTTFQGYRPAHTPPSLGSVRLCHLLTDRIFCTL